MNNHLHFDYTTVGHVTIDVLEDGSRRAGGTAFYSALQAARLGRRTLIITQGVPREIDALLAPYRDELELTVLPASATTTLRTAGRGDERSQRLLAWAGPIKQQLELDTSILHLAPVVREGPSSWLGHAAFVGLTAQGLARRWDQSTGQITHAAPDTAAGALAERCHALVVNEAERACCAELIATAGAAGAVVAVTDEDAPVTVLAPARPAHEVPVPALSAHVDDLGAGDVFAAAFFIALSEAQSPLQAARFASAAAAVRMCGAGAGAIGERGAIEARLLATESPRSG
ncbi:MAG TPA: PfkB family carbohydrate kinase [Solirubrobacteraceae bacterium]|nr:PfkB family carbohydrate kinase [Solirubrobacteraceae bacterium]